MNSAIKYNAILVQTQRIFKKSCILNPAIYQDHKFALNKSIYLINKYLQNNNNKNILAFTSKRNYLLVEKIKEILYVLDKKGVLFLKKINEKFIALHRLFSSIQIVTFDKKAALTVDFWNEYLKNLPDHINIKPKYDHETSHIGQGAPPIETKDEWLLIYHDAGRHEKGLVYHSCTSLPDLNNPAKVIARLPKPLITPAEYCPKKRLRKLYCIFNTNSSFR